MNILTLSSSATRQCQRSAIQSTKPALFSLLQFLLGMSSPPTILCCHYYVLYNTIYETLAEESTDFIVVHVHGFMMVVRVGRFLGASRLPTCEVPNYYYPSLTRHLTTMQPPCQRQARAGQRYTKNTINLLTANKPRHIRCLWTPTRFFQQVPSAAALQFLTCFSITINNLLTF